MSPGERARALITAQVIKDEDARHDLLAGVDSVELAAVTGVLLAMCSNLNNVIAALWGVEPSLAWEALLAGERRKRAQ